MIRQSLLRLAAPVAVRFSSAAVSAPRVLAPAAAQIIRARASQHHHHHHHQQQAPQLRQWRMYSAGGGPLQKAEVEGRIQNILSGFDKVTDPTKINANAHFANDLGLDSLDIVEVVMAIEEEFSIEIPDKDADAIHSVPDAVAYILKQSDAH